VPTDSDDVRRAFEPKAPPLEARWAALEQLRAVGVPVGVCVTPMLPVVNVEGFARRLAAFRPAVLVVQEFHDSGGGFGADTGAAARTLAAERGWGPDGYRRCVERLRRDQPVFEGEAGFFPPD
jgi:hypothetical protein